MLHMGSGTRCIIVAYEAVLVLLRMYTDAKDAASYILPPDLNLKYDHVLDAKETCNTSVLRRNGFVYSHGQALMQTERLDWLHYEDSINCFLTVDVGKGWQVLVQFPQDIFLECSSACDCLYIYDGDSVSHPVLKAICGPHKAEVIRPLVSNGSEVTFHFRAESDCKRSLGFAVRYSAYRRETADWPCSQDEEYRCDMESCIPVRFRCDQLKHCIDENDEGFTGCDPVELICQFIGRLRMRHLIVFVQIVVISIAIVSIICCYGCRHRKRRRIGY